MKNFVKEFREFAMRGNVMDLAVGVIIGAAFGKIVTSLVNDIVMPLIGVLVGRVNFSSLTLKFDSVEIKYGSFLQTTLDFLIVAFVIFLVIHAINKIKRKQAASKTPPPPAPLTKEETLLTEIRDLLKK